MQTSPLDFTARTIVGWSAILVASVVAGLFLVSWPTAVEAQGYWCPPGSRPVPGGGGTMCLCPDGSYADIDGCRGRAGPQPSGCPPGMAPCGRVCCGSGRYCSKYGCTPQGAVDCGTYYCNPGTECASNNRCIPEGAADCGSHYCDQGNICSMGGGCVPRDADDCGQGRHCKAGYKCWPRGEKASGEELTCITEQEKNRRQLAAKAASIASSYGLKDGLLVADFENRHKRAVEYVIDNEVVQDKLRDLLVTRASTALYGPAGDKLATVMTNIRSTLSYTDDFRRGRYYEGSLKITNQVSSILLEALPYGGTSADVLGVTAAIATAYTYGFFWGQ